MNKPVGYSNPHRRLGQEIRKLLTGRDATYFKLRRKLSAACKLIARSQKNDG